MKETMNVSFEVIPHEHQRYPTVGDWRWTPSGQLGIKVSNLHNWRYEACVFIHEFVEAMLCRHAGVAEDEVTNFDMVYEAQRKPGDDSEPGDDALAPYRIQHFLATTVERMFAFMLGVNWSKYEETINSL